MENVMTNLVAIPAEPTEVTPHLATTEVIFRKLLVAIDFDAHAKQVLKTAAAVASSFNAELLLVHSATPVVDGIGADTIPINSYDVNLELAQNRLAELAASEPALRSIHHREIVKYAAPVELVEQAVRAHDVDLVIAGSHGARGLERLALGSVAEAMLRHVTCPVLIVGPHATSFICPFRSVLLASKLELAELRAAQYASALAEKFHGKLILLHVIEQNTAVDGRESGRIEHQVHEELTRLLPEDLGLYSRAEVRAEYGKPAKVATLIAREVCAGVIVCGVRENAALGDHTLGSTLAEIIRHAHCPVLCVRHHSG
jgi:nucleotide-binding universal stress UspA family protein